MGCSANWLESEAELTYLCLLQELTSYPCELVIMLRKKCPDGGTPTISMSLLSEL